MIRKIKYANIDNVTVVEFGLGTVSIVDAEGEDYQSLLIKTNDFTPIGEITGSEKNSDEFKPELALVFHSKESFDVFFSYVENIKQRFEDELESSLSDR